MKLNKQFLFGMLAMLLLLVACGAAGTQESNDANAETINFCNDGVTIHPIPVNNENAMGSTHYVRAYVSIPQGDCVGKIPMEKCTYYAAGYGGGLSCNPIEE